MLANLSTDVTRMGSGLRESMECGTVNPDSLASGVPFAATSVCRPGTQMTKIFQAKWSFVALQFLDLATTLFAFHLGGYEVNPLVARMTAVFWSHRRRCRQQGARCPHCVASAEAALGGKPVLHRDSFLEYCPYRSDDGGTEALAHLQGPDLK